MNWFKIATEGNTADGRYIKREWIEQITATYDATKYAARVFIEHMRGMSPDSSFKCGGTVQAVKSEKVGDKLALFAQIEANDYLKGLNAADQKIFASIEVDENFAATGQAYLSGLGVTDTPASLGLDALKFSSNSNFAKGISGSKDVYLGDELDLSVYAEPTDKKFSESVLQAFKSALTQMFGKQPAPKDEGQSEHIAFTDAQLTTAAAAFAAALPLNTFASKTDLAAVVQRLDTALVTAAGNYTARPPAAGGTTDPKNTVDY